MFSLRQKAITPVSPYVWLGIIFIIVSIDPLSAKLAKQHWTKMPRVASYATALNTAYVRIRTKPEKATLLSICGENGLCHGRGACRHRVALSFFWMLCKNVVPGFAELPCVKDNAERLGFDPAADAFILKKNYTPMDYLETYMFTDQTPRYLEFIVAKIITQLPLNLIPLSTKLHNLSCSKYKKMCTYPPMDPLDEAA